MELQYYGGNCVKVSVKKSSVVVDDNLDELGLKSITTENDVSLQTTRDIKASKKTRLSINIPGEYEILGVAVEGIAARAHMDEADKMTATIYKLTMDDVRIAIVGHIYPSLSESQLESLGTIDILIVPVGGNGFTLDAEGAMQIIKKIEPKIVVPTNYADPKIKYPVPADELEKVVKTLGLEVKETTAKLKIKGIEFDQETAQIVVLERQ